jgi:hypothetical protein
MKSLRQLVAEKDLKYILLTNPNANAGVRTAHLSAVRHWVETSCHLVPEAEYAAPPAPGSAGNTDRLYACDPAAG